MSGSLLGFLGVALVGGSGIRWFRLMQQVRIPKDAIAYLVANGVGALLGIAAFMVGTGAVGGIAAGLAVLGGVTFLGLSAASGQAKVAPAVAVGGSIIDFTASDDQGRPFALASRRGKPLLLKFFRGHW